MIVCFDLAHPLLSLRVGRQEAVPAGLSATALTGGTRDFLRRVQRWGWWWNPTSGPMPEHLADMKWTPRRGSPFLVGSAYWVLPTILWALTPSSGRFYSVFTCNGDGAMRLRAPGASALGPGQVTFTLRFGSHMQAARARWHEMFFDVTSGGIGLGFSGPVGDLEAALLSAPPFGQPLGFESGNQFRHPALETACSGGLGELLQQADLVLLPHGGEHFDGLLLSRTPAGTSHGEIISAALADRMPVMDGGRDASFRRWVTTGQLDRGVF